MITSSGTFDVPLSPHDAIVAMSDMKRMARCVPGAALEGPDEEGAYVGTLKVAFGPKRIQFEGRLTCDFDIANLCGTVKGVGSGKMRNSNVAVSANFTVMEKPGGERVEGEPEESTVDFQLNAEFTGMLADLANAGGRKVLAVLLDEFSRNLQEELTSPGEPDTARKALAAHTLVWRAVRTKVKDDS